MPSRVVLVAGSVVAALLAGEVMMRAALPEARQLFRLQTRRESERGKFCRYDATLGWAGLPDADADFDYVDARHHVHQNRYGFRGTEVPLERSAKRRVVVLGDSFVWGFGVEDAQLFTELWARDRGIEVVNLGVSGYGTDQELLLWRQLGHRLRPDVVLLVVSLYNDIYDVLYAERYGYPKPRFRLESPGGLTLLNVPVPRRDDRPWNFQSATSQVPSAPLLAVASRSALVAAGLLAASRVAPVREAMERAGLLPPRLPGNDWETSLYGQPLDDETRDGLTMVGHLMATLADEVRAAGAELVVTAVPTAVQVDQSLREAFSARHAAPAGKVWDFAAPGRMMDELCRVVGVRCVDLLPDLQTAAQGDPYLYYRWNLHWTAGGHRVVAATLARALGSP